MIKQLRFQQLGIKITLVRPGNVATSPDKTVPPAADVDNWAKTLIKIFRIAESNNLSIPDISLGALNR
jgi:hypothetical protein